MILVPRSYCNAAAIPEEKDMLFKIKKKFFLSNIRPTFDVWGKKQKLSEIKVESQGTRSSRVLIGKKYYKEKSKDC